MSPPATAVPLNRHVLALIAEAEQVPHIARELCDAAGMLPALWPFYLGQAWGVTNKRAGRHAQLKD